MAKATSTSTTASESNVAPIRPTGRRKVSKVWSEDKQTLTLTYQDGTTSTVNMGDFSPEMIFDLARHGLGQKLGDGAAGREPAAAKEHICKIIDALKNGDFSVRGEGEGGSTRVTQLAKAIAALQGQKVEDVVTTLAQLSEDEVKALRSLPAVKLKMQEIRLEEQKAKAKSSSEEEQAAGAALLAGFKS